MNIIIEDDSKVEYFPWSDFAKKKNITQCSKEKIHHSFRDLYSGLLTEDQPFFPMDKENIDLFWSVTFPLNTKCIKANARKKIKARNWGMLDHDKQYEYIKSCLFKHDWAYFEQVYVVIEKHDKSCLHLHLITRSKLSDWTQRINILDCFGLNQMNVNGHTVKAERITCIFKMIAYITKSQCIYVCDKNQYCHIKFNENIKSKEREITNYPCFYIK